MFFQVSQLNFQDLWKIYKRNDAGKVLLAEYPTEVDANNPNIPFVHSVSSLCFKKHNFPDQFFQEFSHDWRDVVKNNLTGKWVVDETADLIDSKDVDKWENIMHKLRNEMRSYKMFLRQLQRF